MSLPISNAYNNILIQCQPALPPHPEELYIMERHANESGIYIRSLDERLTLTAEVYKPGWATHLKQRSVSYTGAPTYLKYFIPIDNKQYGLLVEKLFKLITLEYRCYENTNSELRMMSFTSIVKLFEHICKYTAEQIECEIKRLSNERYIKRDKIQQCHSYRQSNPRISKKPRINKKKGKKDAPTQSKTRISKKKGKKQIPQKATNKMQQSMDDWYEACCKFNIICFYCLMLSF